MTDENYEHIDHLFREQFDLIEVNYNEAHWNQLSLALTATSAVAIGVSQTPWARIIRCVKTYQNVFVLGLFATLLGALIIYFLNDYQEIREVPSFVPSNNVPAPVLNPIDPISGLTRKEAHDSMRKTEIPFPTVVDSLFPKPIQGTDTIDSLKVDSLKGFLFW